MRVEIPSADRYEKNTKNIEDFTKVKLPNCDEY